RGRNLEARRQRRRRGSCRRVRDGGRLSRSRQHRRRRIHGHSHGRWSDRCAGLPRDCAARRDAEHVSRQPGQSHQQERGWLIAERGAPGFYTGETAKLIGDEMHRDGGILSEADLARYQPVWRDVITSTYRGYTLLTMPPSSSGGVVVTETLNILENASTVPPF